MSPTFQPPDVVLARLEAVDGESAIRELHVALVKECPADVKDPAALLGAALERQSISSTALDAEIAMPHARTDAVNRIVYAVGLSERGLVFDSEHPAVRLVLYIGTPTRHVTEYLRLVSGLTRRLREPGVRAALFVAKDEDGIRNALGHDSLPQTR